MCMITQEVKDLRASVFASLKKIGRKYLDTELETGNVHLCNYSGFTANGAYWHVKKIVVHDSRFPKPRLMAAMVYTEPDWYALYIPSLNWAHPVHKQILYNLLNQIETDVPDMVKIRESGRDWYVDKIRRGHICGTWSDFDRDAESALKMYSSALRALDKNLKEIVNH